MEHNHIGLGQPPYDHNKKISCPECIELIWAFRAKLCAKYGWDEWPNDLKGALIGE